MSTAEDRIRTLEDTFARLESRVQRVEDEASQSIVKDDSIGQVNSFGSLDISRTASLFEALGNEVRLRLVVAVWDGGMTASELVRLQFVGSTGQLYHHLKVLTRSGWFTKNRNGQYCLSDGSHARFAAMTGRDLVRYAQE